MIADIRMLGFWRGGGSTLPLKDRRHTKFNEI